MRKITENTAVSLGMVIALLGGVLWLTNIQAQGEVNRQKIDDINSDRANETRLIQSIDRRLSHIEGALGVPHDR